ncbi:PucR family transcriptional regulator [Nocardia brasiliensis]|uniref:PucR family transcriptional regulator n=1 Tax=Nocardia brasiliensis TaxID=37326 RepID=UPI0024578A3C|nr:helix-turn-helix domain-containing protein [Nocardia brasiliensis]
MTIRLIVGHSRRMSSTIANDVEAAVRRITAALSGELPKLMVEMVEMVSTEVPDLRGPDVEEIMLALFRSNIGTQVDQLARGVALELSEPSAEVVQLTRALVHRQVPLYAVLRAFRISTQFMVGRWTDAVAADEVPASITVEVIKAGIAEALDRAEMVTERLVEEYRSEDERLARDRSLAHIEDVRRLLSDVPVDVIAAGNRLGYRLSGRHVALVVRDRTEGLTSGGALDAAVRELVPAGRGLCVRVDLRTAWCWLPSPLDDPPLVSPPDQPVLVAMGCPATGLDGFRRSHRQALEAMRVAELAERPSVTVTEYAEIELAALCSSDPVKCRDFVRARLGGLGAGDSATERLRETLRAFYAANSNYRATAARLGLHHNTIRYRLEQAAQVLGHPVDERRLSVELALHLAEIIGIEARSS